MAQNAFNRTIGVSRADRPAVGMTLEEHALTRTFAGRGRATMLQDMGLSARQRLLKDVLDLREQFETKYNRGALEAIKYANTLPEYAE